MRVERTAGVIGAEVHDLDLLAGLESEAFAELLALIDALAAEIPRPEHRHLHRWQVGDLLIRDNQAVQHLASFDYEWPRHRRLMHRVTVSEPATPVAGGQPPTGPGGPGVSQ